MDIRIEHLMEGAGKARGTAVIIDVFRAATTAAWILGKGAEKIIIAGNFRDAFELKKDDPSYILVGEKHGLSVRGFDHGNSPSAFRDVDPSGKTVVMKTSSGTAGILRAKKADEVLFAGFVNASASVRYLKEKDPRIVSLVGMGWEGERKTDEDELCAYYLKQRLEGREADYGRIMMHLRKAASSRRFFSGKPDWPVQDYVCGLELDRFDFSMKVVKDGTHLAVVKA
jgi:2-phosphosulfolactate phosphatase